MVPLLFSWKIRDEHGAGETEPLLPVHVRTDRDADGGASASP